MKRTRKISALTATLIGLGALTLIGCNDSNEMQRLVVEVTQVNDGNPVVSALFSGTPACDGTDAIPIDVVPVGFTARPFNAAMVVNPGDPFSSFDITSYDLIWHPMSAAAAPLVNSNVFGVGISLMVPLNEVASVGVVIADGTLKTQAWFVALLSPCGGAGTPFSATAELRFHGHVSGAPDNDIVVPAQVTVLFVPFVTTSGK